MKKRIVSILRAAAVLLLFAGCSGPDIPAESSSSPAPSATSAPAAVPELISTGELVTHAVDDESRFWTLGLLAYFTLGRVNQAVFTEWFNETGGTFMEFRSTNGKLLAGAEIYIS